MSAAKKASNELKLTRVYDAPVKVVWDAWCDPQQAARWWGPRGFTLTTHSKDLRVGGIWHYTMHGPDGTDYPNKALYHEVQKHAKLVYDHGANDERAPLFRVTVLFTTVAGNKTQIDMTMALKSAEEAAQMQKFIRKAGGESTWDRLAEYLEKESTGNEKFVIARAFNAPLEVMFDMWTKPEHFAKWLPPTGMEMQYIRAEIRPGGTSFFSMSNAGKITLYGLQQYREITRPSRIVYTQQFCDEKERVVRHPMAPLWPETMLTTVELIAEGPDQTRVVVTWRPEGNVTREELDTFIDMRAGMTQGWGGSFEKLEGLLEK